MGYIPVIHLGYLVQIGMQLQVVNNRSDVKGHAVIGFTSNVWYFYILLLSLTFNAWILKKVQCRARFLTYKKKSI